MSLSSRIRQLFARATDPMIVPAPYSRRGISAFQIFTGTGRNWRKEAGSVWLNSVVGPGLQFLMTQASGEPKWAVWNGEKEMTTHPFWQIVNQDQLSWAETVGALVCSIRLTGNAYLLKKRTEKGAFAGFQFAPIGSVTPMRDRDFQGRKADGTNLVTYYKLKTEQGDKQLPVEQVVHVRLGRHPYDPALGFSPFDSVLREIVSDNNAATLNAGLLKNGGIMGLLFSSKGEGPDDVDPDQIKRLEDSFKRKTTGDMAGSSIVAPFDLNVSTIGYSPDKLAIRDLRMDSLERICSALGLDPMVLSLPSNSKTYSNYEVAMVAAWRNTLIPALMAIAQAVTAQCLQADFAIGGDMRLDTSNVSALLVGIAEKRAMARADYLAGLIDVDEARAETGRPPMSAKQRAANLTRKPKPLKFAPLTNPKSLPSNSQFHSMVKKHSIKLQSIARKAASGALSPLDFQDEFMAQLERMHSEAAWYGRIRGLQDSVAYDAEIDGAIGKAVSETDLVFVQKIVDRLETDEAVDEEYLAGRARNYTKRARGSANQAFVANSPDMTGTWNLGFTEDHCEDCIHFHKLGEMLLDDFPTQPGMGETVCSVGCDCNLVRSDGIETYNAQT